MLNSMAELEAGFSSGYTDAYTAGLEAIKENAPLLDAEITAGFDTEKQLIDEKTSELGSTMGEGISTGISDQAEEVKEAAQNLVDQNIVQTLQESAGVDGSASTKTIEIGQYIADGLVTGMQNNQANVIATAQNLASETYNQFQLGLSSDKFAEIGRQICNGLVSGINSGRSGVINAATKVAADAYEAAKKELDINSTSKKFAWLGKMSGEGYVEGLKKKMQSVKDVMAAAVPEASIGAAAGMKRGKASSGGQVINQTVNVYSKTDNLIDTARAFKQSQKEAARAW